MTAGAHEDKVLTESAIDLRVPVNQDALADHRIRQW